MKLRCGVHFQLTFLILVYSSTTQDHLQLGRGQILVIAGVPGEVLLLIESIANSITIATDMCIVPVLSWSWIPR